MPRFGLRKKYLIGGVIAVWLLDYLGIFIMIREDDYTNFVYPMEDENVLHYANQIRKGEKADRDPINVHDFQFMSKCKHKCLTSDGNEVIAPRLTILVKSAPNHFERRDAIRQSWGYEQRFPDIIIRTVFMLGIPSPENGFVQDSIDIEQEQYRDIVQSDFIDTYFNNTLKTSMSMKWAITYCPQSQFFLFVDDDFFVSTKNLLQYLQNPADYPEFGEKLKNVSLHMNQSDNLVSNHSINDDKLYLKNINSTGTDTDVSKNHLNRTKMHLQKTSSKSFEKSSIDGNETSIRYSLNVELSSDECFYAGYVMESRPLRFKFSKWFITLDEYKWNRWPSFVPAGTIILSREALHVIYYVSMYTQNFRFDDVFIGFAALKSGIEPVHSDEIHFNKKTYHGPESYRYVITSHGYNDYEELVRIWTAQKDAGYA